MKNPNKKIKTKLNIQIGISIFIVVSAMIIYIILSTKGQIREKELKNVENTAIDLAGKINTQIEKSVVASRTLACIFSRFQTIEEKNRRITLSNMAKNLLFKRKDLLSVWAFFEKNAIDRMDSIYDFGELGSPNRFVAIHFRDGNQLKTESWTQDQETELETKPYYNLPKIAGKTYIPKPFLYSYTKSKVNRKYIVSICSPIYNKYEFAGVAGVDLNLNSLYEVLDSVNYNQKARSYIVSYDGSIVFSSTYSEIGKNFNEIYPKIEKEKMILKRLASGEKFTFSEYYKADKYHFQSIPFALGDTEQYWALMLSVPENQLVSQNTKSIYILFFIGIISLVFLIVFANKVLNKFIEPLKSINKRLFILSKGNLTEYKDLKINEKSTLFPIAETINLIAKGLKNTSNFSHSITNANFLTDFKPLSKYDEIGNSLIELKRGLEKNKKEEIERKKQDKIRTWRTQGINNFSDILRKNNDNISELSYSIISNLVKYINATQGGIFIYNEENQDDKFLELKAATAYDRRKYLKKKIIPAEGLVGACALEKETIYITEIPEEYLEIESGLGDSNPSYLLLVPLVANNELNGVIEISSFHELEKYEMEFVEKIAENIASTINAVKINQKTSELLQKSDEHSQVMLEKEDQMRQNLQELQAAQEETSRREAEISGIVNALNYSSLVIELSTEGKIININKRFLELLDKDKEDVIGRFYKDVTNKQWKNIGEYDFFWEELQNGKTQKVETELILQNDKTVWLSETYTPVLDENRQVKKILNIANNISETKQKEIEIKATAEKLQKQEQIMKRNLAQLEEAQSKAAKREAEMRSVLNGLDTTFLLSEFDMDGFLININPDMKMLLNLKENEIEQFNIRKKSENLTDEIWAELEKGEVKKQTEYIEYRKVWISQTFIPILDNNGKPYKILEIAEDISEIKQQEKELRSQTEMMTAQEEMMKMSLEQLQIEQKKASKALDELDSILDAINTSSLFSIIDIDGNIKEINERFSKLLQKENKDLIDKHLTETDIIPNREIYENIWQNVKKGIVFRDIIEINLEDEIIYLIANLTPVLDDKNKPIKVICIAANITSAKLQEKELKKQSKKLQKQEQILKKSFEKMQKTKRDMSIQQSEMKALVTAIDSAMLEAELSPQGEFISVNKNYVETTKYTIEELKTKNIFDLISPEEKEKYEEAFEKIANFEQVQFETKRLDKEGEEHWYLASYTPVKDLDENIGKILYIAQDITHTKKLEQEAREQTDELIDIQEELTLNIEELNATQEEMMDKHKGLQEANKELEKLKEEEEKRINEIENKYKLREKELLEKINKLEK